MDARLWMCDEGTPLLLRRRGWSVGAWLCARTIGDVRSALQRPASCSRFHREFIEQRVVAVVGRPDGQIIAPGDSALGRFPEQPRVEMLGEFIQADVTAINRHRLGICRKDDPFGRIPWTAADAARTMTESPPPTPHCATGRRFAICP